MKRVLLADDSPTTQKLIAITIANENYDLTYASDGQTAWTMVQQNPPDILLADVHMPGMDGLELCRQVKSNPKFQHIRVILLYGVFEQVEEDKIRQVGADGKLVKPFETQVLLDLLGKMEKETPKRALTSLNHVFNPEPSISKPVDSAPVLPSRETSAGFSQVSLDDLWVSESQGGSSTSQASGWTESKKLSSLKMFDQTTPEKGLMDSTNFNRGEQKNQFTSTTNRIAATAAIGGGNMDSEEVKKMTAEIVERVVWEVVPEIAERVIRQELEKLLREV